MTGTRFLVLSYFCAQAASGLAANTQPQGNVTLHMSFGVVSCEREDGQAPTTCSATSDVGENIEIGLQDCFNDGANTSCSGSHEYSAGKHGLAFGAKVMVTKTEDARGKVRYFLNAWLGNGQDIDTERWTKLEVQLNKTGNLSNPINLTSTPLAIDYEDGGMRSFFPALKIKAKQ